jgi:anti-sigma factor RsiW
MRHPDEGEIHAWLDGALDSAQAAELEAHVAACPPCAAAVAEARGLIAGASRILMALDAIPGGVIPAASAPPSAPPGDHLSVRRTRQHEDRTKPVRRHVPWYAGRPLQVAAGLLLVVGVGGIVARNRTADEVSIQFETDMSPGGRGPSAISADLPAAPSPAPLAVTTPGSTPEIANSAAAVGSASARSAEERRADGNASRPSAGTPSPSRGTAVADAFGGADVSSKKVEAAAASSQFGSREKQTSVPATPPPPPAVPLQQSNQLTLPRAQGQGTQAQAPAQGVVAQAPATAGKISQAPGVRAEPLSPLLDSLRAVQVAPSALMGKTANALVPDTGESSIRLRRVVPPAGSGIVAGTVADADGKPLQLATVSADGRAATQTRQDGSFELPLPAGRYTLEARRIGYVAQRIDGVVLASGDTTHASFTLPASTLALSSVVVTGTSAGAVGGSCFALDVDAGNANEGIPLLPRRVRIQLAATDESPRLPFSAGGAAGGAAGGRGGTRGDAERQARAALPATSEPASPLPWYSIAPDSIAATWATATDVVTLRLRVRGTNVTGTATSSEGSPRRTATLTGRQVSCGG